MVKGLALRCLKESFHLSPWVLEALLDQKYGLGGTFTGKIVEVGVFFKVFPFFYLRTAPPAGVNGGYGEMQ